MADRKQQHFVPKCHLKPFSIEGKAKAINLFNVNAKRSIPSAPVKGQCASSYFYGEDLVFETALGSLEGRYSTILRSVIDGSGIDESELRFLCDFVYLQYNRTEAMLRQRQTLIAGLAGRMTKGRENLQIDPLPTHLDNIREMMRLFSETNWAIDDLKAVLVSNTSKIEFVTSDNPAVLSNRMYLQKYHDRSFGLLSSGSIMLMPLSPKWLIILYDRNAYWVERRASHVVEVESTAEIAALNAHQYINCDKNIYFSDWRKKCDVERGFGDAQRNRSEKTYDLQAMIPARDAASEAMFRKASEAEIVKSRQMLISFTNTYPDPGIWPKFLRYRRDGFGYIHPALLHPMRRIGLDRYGQDKFRKVRL